MSTSCRICSMRTWRRSTSLCSMRRSPPSHNSTQFLGVSSLKAPSRVDEFGFTELLGRTPLFDACYQCSVSHSHTLVALLTSSCPRSTKLGGGQACEAGAVPRTAHPRRQASCSLGAKGADPITEHFPSFVQVSLTSHCLFAGLVRQMVLGALLPQQVYPVRLCIVWHVSLPWTLTCSQLPHSRIMSNNEVNRVCTPTSVTSCFGDTVTTNFSSAACPIDSILK